MNNCDKFFVYVVISSVDITNSAKYHDLVYIYNSSITFLMLKMLFFYLLWPTFSISL